MSDDKHKNIPTLDDVIKPGDLEKAVTSATDDKKENKSTTNKRVADRRVSKEALADGKIERRIEERRKKQGDADKKRRATDRRTTDRRDPDRPKPDGIVDKRVGERRKKQRRITDSLDLDSLVEVIMNDMMPDLEQHMRVQLRFELERHLPRFVAKDDEDK